jgi:hypothetical protein
LGGTIVFELTMSHGCMVALEDIVQEYPVGGVFGDGEAD